MTHSKKGSPHVPVWKVISYIILSIKMCPRVCICTHRDTHTSDHADNDISSLKRKIDCVRNPLFIGHRISLWSTPLTLEILFIMMARAVLEQLTDPVYNLSLSLLVNEKKECNNLLLYLPYFI